MEMVVAGNIRGAAALKAAMSFALTSREYACVMWLAGLG